MQGFSRSILEEVFAPSQVLPAGLLHPQYSIFSDASYCTLSNPQKQLLLDRFAKAIAQRQNGHKEGINRSAIDFCETLIADSQQQLRREILPLVSSLPQKKTLALNKVLYLASIYYFFVVSMAFIATTPNKWFVRFVLNPCGRLGWIRFFSCFYNRFLRLPKREIILLCTYVALSDELYDCRDQEGRDLLVSLHEQIQKRLDPLLTPDQHSHFTRLQKLFYFLMAKQDRSYFFYNPNKLNDHRRLTCNTAIGLLFLPLWHRLDQENKTFIQRVAFLFQCLDDIADAAEDEALDIPTPSLFNKHLLSEVVREEHLLHQHLDLEAKLKGLNPTSREIAGAIWNETLIIFYEHFLRTNTTAVDRRSRAARRSHAA